MSFLLAAKDGAGLHGSIFHYAFVMAFVGSAFLIFLYLWRNGRLDMDEGPKHQMMQESSQEQEVFDERKGQ